VRRLLAGSVLVGVIVLGASAAYAAPSYPPLGPSGTVDPSAAACGTTVTVSGSGWLADSTVSVRLDSTSIGSATTNGGGSFTQSVQIPTAISVGAHTVTFSGENSSSTPESVTTTFTATSCGVLAAATTTSSGALAFTGSNISLYVGAAIALILIGLMLSIVTTRRHKARFES
jgi:hypothetical protein